MAGPFARILIQVVVAGARVMTNAFVQAYQQAAANPQGAKKAAEAASRKLRKEMAHEEALKILNFDKNPATIEELVARFDKYFAANDPKKGGSFYLQSKFYRAREVVEKQLKEEAEEKAGGASEDSGDEAKDK